MILGTFEQHIEEMCRQRSMTLEEAGAFLRRLGVQAVCAGAHELPDPLESRKRLEGVGLFFSDVYGTLPFISQQADEAAIRALLQKTAALGAKRLLVTSEPYRDMDDAVKREEDLCRTIDGLKRTVGLASACGVEIELEDFDCAATPFSFTDDLLRVFQEVPGIRFAFDSGNFVLAGEDEIAAQTERMALAEALGTLEPMHRRIVTLRYFRNMSQKETAAVLGLTQVKISREEKKIFAKLRKELCV